MEYSLACAIEFVSLLLVYITLVAVDAVRYHVNRDFFSEIHEKVSTKEQRVQERNRDLTQ